MKKTILIMLLSFGFVSADIKKDFYENGALKYISISKASDKSFRTVKTFYPNGSIKKDFLQTGSTGCSLKTYHSNGNLNKELTFDSIKDCNRLL